MFIHHGPQLATLATGLVERLSAPGGDPFARLVVGVPTAGVRDWLTRRIASDVGIAANIAMPYPGRFVAAAIGVEDGDDPWSVERLTWAVLDVLDEGAVDVPGWTAVESGRHGGSGPSHRFTVARRIADLFDRYSTTRPEILRQWQLGVPGDGTVRSMPVGGTPAAGDEHTVGSLPPSMHWQFDLWRRVRQRLGSPSVAEQIPERIEQLRRNELDPALPATVELFGVSTLSRSQLDVLAGLAEWRDVHVSLLHPSAVAWLRATPVDRALPTVRNRRGDNETASPDRHPLLASWGRPGAETAALGRGLGAPAVVDAVTGPPLVRPVTLLDHLRADLQADRPPSPFARPAADTSIQVHACHGTIRQLEVLRDALGHLFVADPELRPDDVIVICPDLQRFEPFAAAVFGRGTLPVPVMVSDLSMGTENPVAAAAARILHTVAGRCTASDVLAVAALPPVGRKLTITIDDLDRYAGWTARLGTRWGLDSDHRQAWFDGDIDLGTWERSLRALLLGIAMPAPTPRTGFGGIVPFDDLGGDDVPSVGRLAELVARLRTLRSRTLGRRTVDEWCDMLVETVDQFCATAPADAWQTAFVLEAIDDVRRTSVVAGYATTAPLAFDDLLAIVDGVVAHPRGRVQLRTGRVAITGSAPMRNVPAKVIAVLGFDENSLRRTGIDGDDLLAVRPCVGERDRHAERRNLLLDAIFAADRTLVITCDGSDVTTNRQIRFAVQLNELLDVVAATLEPVGGIDRGTGDSPVLTRHPLHAYDERNFDLVGVSASGVFSFDDVMCRAADTRRHRSDEVAGWRRFAIEAPVPPVVSLAQLVEACVRPAHTLLRGGLDVRLPGEVERADHEIPLSIGKLAASALGRRLLERYCRRAGALTPDGAPATDWESVARATFDEWAAAERLSGSAPPGRLIDDTLVQISDDIDVIAAAAECAGLDRVAVLCAGDGIDIDVELGLAALPGAAESVDRLRLVDRVDRIADGVICRLGYRRPRSGLLVAAAVDLAAAVLATGDTRWRALTVTRAAQGNGAAECHLLSVTAADPLAAARTMLETAAGIHVAALRGAVPVFETTTRRLYDDGYVDEDELDGTDYRNGRS